jgi:hypothetical protein
MALTYSADEYDRVDTTPSTPVTEEEAATLGELYQRKLANMQVCTLHSMASDHAGTAYTLHSIYTTQHGTAYTL